MENFVLNIDFTPAEPVKVERGTCNRCGKGDAQEWHTCPYSEDINNDSESECTCCKTCERACADDI